MNEVIISTIIAGVFTLAGVFYQRRTDKSRIETEQKQIEASISQQYQKMLTDEITARREFEQWARERLRIFERYSSALALQVIDLGGTPVKFKDYVETE